MNTSLLSTTSRVEAPFIIAEIAGYTFGLFNNLNTKPVSNFLKHFFPFVKNLLFIAL